MEVKGGVAPQKGIGENAPLFPQLCDLADLQYTEKKF